MCGETEPRIKSVLSEQWSQHLWLHGVKEIGAARKSAEYSLVYRGVLFDQLLSDWGDSEEQAHACERIYIQFIDSETKPHQWWQDRLCVDLPLNSEESSRKGKSCGVRPGAKVSFENTLSDKKISILLLAPSSDVSFPRAGTFPHQSEPGYRIVSNNDVGHVWAIPDSVEFEWKAWPRTMPQELKTKGDLKSARLYVDEVRGKVQLKRALVVVRGRIPPEVIADVSQMEQAAKLGQPIAASLKLFFIFTADGLRFRWEEWNGGCIKRYGGDEIDLPRNQLLSGDWICGEPEPESCPCRASPLPAPAPSIQPALVVINPRLLNEKASSLL